jgi:vitamin B12 transporter
MLFSSPVRARRVVSAFVPFITVLSSPQVLAQALPPGTLDPIVVTATRTPQPLSRVLADVSVVDRAAIERSGAASVADLLARQPGIEMTRNGGPGTSTSVFVRGAETRHTAVYIDGVRVDSQSTGGAVWEQIPLEQIERIEVLRGPAAAIYGSDAIAGVVQLFTKRGEGPARPSASFSVGSHGTAQAQAGISGAAQAIDYALSASHGRSDGFDSRTPANTTHTTDRDGWQRTSMQGRVGLQIDGVHRVDVSLLGSRLRSGYDAFTPGFDDQNHNSLWTGNLAWQAKWNADASTRVQIGQTKSTYETQPSYYRTETTLRDFTAMHEQRLNPHHVLTGTLERREDRLLNPGVGSTPTLQDARFQNAVGLGWRGSFGAHELQAHVRHDEDSEFDGKTTGGLAWGWQFAQDWRVTASTATAFRVPTLYQRFSAYGNPNLVPETSRNVELGLRWAAAGHEASLSAWRNKVGNLIAFGPAGPCADAFGCYINVGRAELKGITLAGSTQWGPVQLRGSLDWHDPTNLDTGKVLQRRARQLATLGAETALAGWTFGAELQAAGKRYENAANTQKLGGYGLVNLYASKPLSKALTLQARIDNVADKPYELARQYATVGRNIQVALRWAP